MLNDLYDLDVELRRTDTIFFGVLGGDKAEFGALHEHLAFGISNESNPLNSSIRMSVCIVAS
jgi:hypothetical protein